LLRCGSCGIRDRIDADFQHDLAAARRHRVTWGAGLRVTRDDIGNTLFATSLLLGDTVAVCKRYYIHPLVVESYLAGELAHLPRVARASRGLSCEESMLARFLRRRPRSVASDEAPWHVICFRVLIELKGVIR